MNIGLGLKKHSMLVLCKTKDAVSGSELFIARIVTVTLARLHEMKYAQT